MDNSKFIRKIEYYFNALKNDIEINKQNIEYRYKIGYNTIKYDCDDLELWLRALRDKLENG
jgi:hypothetical protein